MYDVTFLLEKRKNTMDANGCRHKSVFVLTSVFQVCLYT